MRSFYKDRVLDDSVTSFQYLRDALNNLWEQECAYLGNREDMTHAWKLQNEIRTLHGISLLHKHDLERACEHFNEEAHDSE